MKKIKLSGHQGDVWIERVSEETVAKATCKSAKPIPRTGKGLILALGEVTGHMHSIAWDCLGLTTQAPTGEIYFQITGEYGLLTHDTHDPIKISRGYYKSLVQLEYTPEEIRNVAD